jgi:NADH:ubiquinone oxidoreductase subunit B-like Fe-S oxidoreductase
MKTALLQTYEATPAPRWSLPWAAAPSPAVPFGAARKSPKGWTKLLPVDLFIPGCPPHPLTNLHALLNFFK